MERKPIAKNHLENLKVRANIINVKEMEVALLKNERDFFALQVKKDMGLPEEESWNINFNDGFFEKQETEVPQ